jgi:alpha-D-ribose 1-methylphosphonate 5-triphosphate diphosphatase
MLPAAFRLVSEGLLDLPAAIRMLTLNAAHAVGLADRGELAPGKLGDLAIVRLDQDGWPHVEATIVGGRFASHFVRHPEVHKPQPALPPVPQPGTEELVGA